MTCTLLFYPYKKQKIATSITTVNWQECLVTEVLDRKVMGNPGYYYAQQYLNTARSVNALDTPIGSLSFQN